MTLAYLSLPPANVPFVFNLVKQPPPSPSCLLEPCRLGIEDFSLPTTSHFSHRTHPQATLSSVDHTLALYFTKRRSYASSIFYQASIIHFSLYFTEPWRIRVDVGSHPCRGKYQASHSLLYLIPHNHYTGWLLGEVAECLAGARRRSRKPPLPLQYPASPWPYRIQKTGTKEGHLAARVLPRATSSTAHPVAASPVPLAPGGQGHTRIRARSVLPRPHASLLASPLTRARSIRPRAHAALRPSPLTRPRSILPSPDAAPLASPLTGARSALPRPHALLPASPLARARSVPPRPHPSLSASPLLLHGAYTPPRSRQGQRPTNSRGCNPGRLTCERTGTASGFHPPSLLPGYPRPSLTFPRLSLS